MKGDSFLRTGTVQRKLKKNKTGNKGDYPLSCHYFMDWTWDFGGPDGYPNHDDVDKEQRALIEMDDIPMVEAQQRNLELFESVQDIPVKQDKFVIEVHRVLKRMYEEQGMQARPEVSRQAAAE